MKIHKSIVLKFWIRDSVNPVCEDWVYVSLVLYFSQNI